MAAMGIPRGPPAHKQEKPRGIGLTHDRRPDAETGARRTATGRVRQRLVAHRPELRVRPRPRAIAAPRVRSTRRHS